MKKQTARLIVITVVSVLLVSVCCFGVYMYFDSRNSATGESEVIFQFSPESVESIKILRGNYGYELEKDDGIWELEDDKDKKIIQQSVKEAINVFSLVKGTEIKMQGEPLFTIRVEIDRNFGETVFELAKDNESYYLKNKRGKIYAVSQVLYSVAERKADFYRDKTVTKINSFGEEGENQFKSYNFKYRDEDGKTVEINVRLKNSAEVSRFDKSSQYMITSPYLKVVDAADFESKVLSKIPGIKVENFISEENADLEPYGLDKNTRGTLTVKYDNSSFVLYVGKPAENLSEVYCMVPDSKEVFTVRSSNLDFLGYTAFEFVNKSVFPYNTDYIRSVRINSGELTFNVRFDGNNYFIDERPVSKETVESFFEELKKLEVASVEGDVYNGVELMNITLSGSDGAQTVYKILKTEDEKIIVSEGGKIFMKIDSSELEAFIESLKQLEKTPI